MVVLRWLIAYEGVNLLGVPRDALQLATRWDAAIPVLGWTEPAYFLAYPLLLVVPLIVRTRGELRRFCVARLGHEWNDRCRLARHQLDKVKPATMFETATKQN